MEELSVAKEVLQVISGAGTLGSIVFTLWILNKFGILKKSARRSGAYSKVSTRVEISG